MSELITSPTGSLAYHLVLAFSVLGALQSVLNSADERSAEMRGRMVFGLGALLGLRALLFLAAGLAVQGVARLGMLLPVVDRTVGVVSVVLLVWLWAFPRPRRAPDAATLLVVALVFMMGSLSALYWASNGAPESLNQNDLGFAWDGLTFALALGGAFLLFVSKPAHWGAGAVMLLLVAVGALVQMFAALPGDTPGMLRVAQLAAFPLLFSLPRRLDLGPAPAQVITAPTVEARSPEAPVPPAAVAPVPAEANGKRQAGLPASEFKAIVQLAASDKPEEVAQLLVRHLAHGLLADVTLLMTPPDSGGQIIVMCGYDLIREEPMGGTLLDQKVIPGYAEALQRGRALQIPESNKLEKLARALGTQKAGHLLVLPLANAEGKPLAALALLSPYSKRVWNADDQLYVREAAPLISHLLEKTQRLVTLRENSMGSEARLREISEERDRIAEEHRAALGELDVLRHEMETARDSVETAQMQQELQRLRSEVAAGASAGGALMASAEELNSLQTENDKLKAELANFDKLKKGASAMVQDRDRLKAELAALKASPAVAAQPASAAPGLSLEQAEVIASIAQDLRQPMSSIIGYTDLLLSESVGILGALQRKFLDRVKASTERTNSLISNLIQITALDSGNVQITPEAVDLSSVIDNSIGETSSQMREKNISLRVDLADNLPRMHTDKDAIQQILTHLLSNAGAATPNEGEILLRARSESRNGHAESVLMEVADSGEGIPEDDLPRVFSRLYRADNPLIQGVGETGVGLSIAKTLTEALGGSIWVESQLGKGSTFRVRLPIETPLEVHHAGSAEA
ncbi:MAG: hypothetical protein EPO32_08495 [Anaerolineae bacterium]|nr:MAG: hypothetical protein EPO32_08495 [Anaerolineae bacterium]